jgi:hypothetical protein
LQDTPKFAQMGIFALKIYHLATLTMTRFGKFLPIGQLWAIVYFRQSDIAEMLFSNLTA